MTDSHVTKGRIKPVYQDVWACLPRMPYMARKLHILIDLRATCPAATDTTIDGALRDLKRRGVKIESAGPKGDRQIGVLPESWGLLKELLKGWNP